eukprot:COSAG01_NODE_318_length_18932_cov_26.063983_1_plen_483_part_00
MAVSAVPPRPTVSEMSLRKSKYWEQHEAGAPWLTPVTVPTVAAAAVAPPHGRDENAPHEPKVKPDYQAVLFALFRTPQRGARNSGGGGGIGGGGGGGGSSGGLGGGVTQTAPAEGTLDRRGFCALADRVGLGEEDWGRRWAAAGDGEPDTVDLDGFRALCPTRDARIYLAKLGHRNGKAGRRRLETLAGAVVLPWSLAWSAEHGLWYWWHADGITASWFPQRERRPPVRGRRARAQRLQAASAEVAAGKLDSAGGGAAGGGGTNQPLRRFRTQTSGDFAIQSDAATGETVFLRKKRGDRAAAGPQSKHVVSVVCGYDTRVRPEEREHIACAEGAEGGALSAPSCLAYDAQSDVVFIAECHRIRRVPLRRATEAGGVRSALVPAGIIAGAATAGFADGVGTEARFNTPRGIWWDARARRLWVADSGNHALRCVCAPDNPEAEGRGGGGAGGDWEVQTVLVSERALLSPPCTTYRLSGWIHAAA